MARPSTRLWPTVAGSLAAAVLLASIGCGSSPTDSARAEARASRASEVSIPSRSSSQPAAYTVSPQGGTPATGPGSRYNHCERIWCLEHKENFALDHFQHAHIGWVLHDDAMGDVFVPRGRSGGPSFPKAKHTALQLCGAHVHPHSLGPRGGPVRDGMYTVGLNYSRGHFRQYGTRLEPCCVNGVGWDFVHSGGRFFRFHEVEEYRAHPERGWQAPFRSEPAPPQ